MLKHDFLKSRNSNSAFTIIELLVVIVVIGILAAITIISYSGISQRATLASLQSDLSNASTKLKAYQTIYGSYPTLDTNNCPSAPTVDNNYCLKFSPNTVIATTPFAGYIANNSTTPQTFSLTLSSNNTQGVITESSKPSVLTPAPLDPVADWIATPQGDHYGNYYDPVSKSWASVTRSTPKTIYDPATQHIYDVPANYLAINPWSAYQPGGTGSAAVIEEARTNYLVNSSFETDTNSDGLADNLGVWYGSGITKPSLVADAMHGGKAQNFTLDNNTLNPTTVGVALTGTVVGSFAAGESATMSVYVKDIVRAPSKTWRFYLYAMDSAGAILGQISKAYSDSAGLNALTYSNLPVGTSKVWGYIAYLDALPPGEQASITIDAVQIEKGAFATSYIPTTTGMITRNKDAVTIPASNWNTNAGTIVGLIGGKTIASGVSSIMTWRALATDRITIGTTTTGVTSTIDGSDTEFSATKAGDGTIPLVASVKWKAGDNFIAYMNGIGGTPLGPVVSPIYIDSAFIGSYIASHSFANEAPISRLVVYPTALSDADIQSLSTKIKDGP